MMGRDTPSRPQCCCWKGKDPHLHTFGGKMDTVTPSHPSLVTVERVGIKPHVHNAVGYTLMFTLLTVERDTLSSLPLLIVLRDTP
jgi:hypothetical protein